MIVYLNDTGFLWNFAVVNRLDLLERLVESKNCDGAYWVREVEREIKHRIPEHAEALSSMLGRPLDPTNAERGDTQLVRSRFFERDGDGASKHLGESECIAVGITRYSTHDVIACTEDGSFREWCGRTATEGSDAYEYTGGRRWTPIVTRNVLAIAVKQGWATETERLSIVEQLHDLRRPMLAPSLRA